MLKENPTIRYPLRGQAVAQVTTCHLEMNRPEELQPKEADVDGLRIERVGIRNGIRTDVVTAKTQRFVPICLKRVGTIGQNAIFAPLR